MRDSRIIGTWASDGPRTATEIAARRDIQASRKRKLQRLFGKLELRYTRSHCYAKLNGETTVSRYRVVASDASSVAIVTRRPFSEHQILHLHFEGNRYWICLGTIREFFKRKAR